MLVLYPCRPITGIYTGTGIVCFAEASYHNGFIIFLFIQLLICFFLYGTLQDHYKNLKQHLTRCTFKLNELTFVTLFSHWINKYTFR